jgi:predicted RNA-binding Zn ribbon-like protein
MDTGGLALALARTVRAGPDGSGADRLQTAAELEAWLAEHRAWTAEPGPEVGLRVAEFRDLRGAIRELLGAAARGGPLPTEATARVNEASARVPFVTRLDVSDRRRPKTVEQQVSGSDTTRALAAIARSAIELLGGPDRERVRVCPARGCGRFFLAGRPDQTWCSTACGTRERVARHYARGKSSQRVSSASASP